MKSDVSQVPYEVVDDLETAIGGFMGSCDNRRYHKTVGNVTPAEVIDGRRERSHTPDLSSLTVSK